MHKNVRACNHSALKGLAWAAWQGAHLQHVTTQINVINSLFGTAIISHRRHEAEEPDHCHPQHTSPPIFTLSVKWLDQHPAKLDFYFSSFIHFDASD